MKTYLALVIILIFLFFLISFAPLSLAQGPSEEMADEVAADEEMYDYLHGIVMNIDPHSRQIAIRENDSGEIYQMFVGKDATIEGADSLSDIGVDDSVNVDYYTVNNQLVATNIVVEEKSVKQEAPATLEKVLSD